MDRSNKQPLHFEILSDSDGTKYVREELFFKILVRVRKLMEDKKEATANGDSEKLADCERREEGLKDYIDSYEHMRTEPLLSLFT